MSMQCNDLLRVCGEQAVQPSFPHVEILVTNLLANVKAMSNHALSTTRSP